MTFFSRTKNRLWTKGETSGHFLQVVSITPDCDNDTLLVLANPIGPTCHLGTSSCFSLLRLTGRSSISWNNCWRPVSRPTRKALTPPDSMPAAPERIAQKVGEEGVETALAATVNDREELTNEASDLIYHLLVLLQDQDLDLSTIINNLRARHK